MILVISGLLTGYFSADLSADALSFFRAPAFTSSNCFIRDLLCNCVIMIYLRVYLFTKLFLWPFNAVIARSLAHLIHARVHAHSFTPLSMLLLLLLLMLLSRLLLLLLQDGRTALHYAASFARDDVIKLLLSKRAEPMTPAGVSLEDNHTCVHTCTFGRRLFPTLVFVVT